MLIVVPPSESKRPSPGHGPPVDLESLSFPALTPTRRRVIDALTATSARADAFDRLQLRPSMAPEIAGDARVLELPTMPVLDVYTGPLHDGLDAHRLSAAARQRAAQDLVVVSPLWGALRPGDRIPHYRLHVCAHLAGLDDLEPIWRAVLPDALAEAAGPSGVVVDLRSPSVQAMGLPRGLADRTVTVRVDQGPRGHRLGDVLAKRIRGEAAHHLLESGADLADFDALADVLSRRWPVRLSPPGRPTHPWTMTLAVER